MTAAFVIWLRCAKTSGITMRFSFDPLSRTFLISLTALTIQAASVTAKPRALAFMNGVWIGEGIALTLDTERMLANIDSSKPFQRDALYLQNITDQMVVFSVRDRSFIGLFDGDGLALTGGGLTSTVRLSRREQKAR